MDPKLIKDKKNFLLKLRLNFPDLSINQIKARLIPKNIFVLKKELIKSRKKSFGR